MYDKNFLLDLDNEQLKIIYARIITLTWDEHPIQEITGRITDGSINIQSSSAMRRSFQLSMTVPEVDFSDYLWGLNTKIKLAVGVENHIHSSYPDIIWFEQGVFVINSLSISYQTTSYSISLSGQDKMCLLDGSISGSLGSSVDFGCIEEETGVDATTGNKIFTKRKYPIINIIREAVHAYAGEPMHNIVINDIADRGLELQTYRMKEPMFIWRGINDNTYRNGSIDGAQSTDWGPMSSLEAQGFIFEPLTGDFVNTEPDIAIVDGEKCYIAKIDYGEVAGYKEIELVYPGDLIAGVGESLTSVLDKIVQMLGEFEYFYDIDGRFIFQKKKTYITSSWSPLEKDDNGISYVNNNEMYSYIFTDSKMFTSINNTPDLKNVKNDFSVWGKTAATELPIHMRYAIDKKPYMYCSINVSDDELVEYNKKYGFQQKGQSSICYVANQGSIFERPYQVHNDVISVSGVDSEYYENVIKLSGYQSSYNSTLQEANIPVSTFAHYGTRVLCDWRELIYQMAVDYRKYNHLNDFEVKVMQANEHFPTGKTGYEQYYIDMEGFWRQIYAPTEKDKQVGCEYDDDGWNKAIIEDPASLKFWLDFIDTQGSLGQFSVPVIGQRAKVVNDDQVKAIYYKEIPPIIFVDPNNPQSNFQTKETGYSYFNAPQFDVMFKKSAQGKSAKEEIDNLIYTHGYCPESISISSIPIYYLDVNTRIYIHDMDSGIEGDYIINQLSVPLAHSGIMTISANKAPDRII